MQNDKLYAQKDEKLHEQEDNSAPTDRMILSSAGYQGLEDSFDFGDELHFDHDLEEHFTPPPPTSLPDVQRDLFWPLDDDAPQSSYPPSRSIDRGSAWGDDEPKRSTLGHGHGNRTLSRVEEDTHYPMNSSIVDRSVDVHESQHMGFASNAIAGSHDGGFLRSNFAALQSDGDAFNGERLVGTLLTSNHRDLPDYREMGRLSERRRGQFEPYANPRWNPDDDTNHEGTTCSKSLWSFVPPTEAEAETKETEAAVRKARSQSLTSSFGALSLPRVGIDDSFEPLPLHPGDGADDASADPSLEPLALDQHPRDPDGTDFHQPPVKRRRPSPAMDAQPLEEPPQPTPRLKQRPTQLLNVDEEDIDDHDILLGRGGKTNHHPGNAEYLQLIQEREVEYMLLGSRNEKTVYAMGLVQQLREEGIRFLKRDQKNKKLWNDVGDDKMREKVSQNLRERQPQLRKKMELDKGQKEKSPERKPRLEKSSQLTDSVVAMETPSQVQSEQQPPVIQPLEESQQGDTADLAEVQQWESV